MTVDYTIDRDIRSTTTLQPKTLATALPAKRWTHETKEASIARIKAHWLRKRPKEGEIAWSIDDLKKGKKYKTVILLSNGNGKAASDVRILYSFKLLYSDKVKLLVSWYYGKLCTSLTHAHTHPHAYKENWISLSDLKEYFTYATFLI